MLGLKIYWLSRITRTQQESDDAHLKHGENSDSEKRAFARALRKETPYRLA